MNQQQTVQIDEHASLREWLISDSALPVLRSVAKSVLGWARGDNLIQEILCIGRDDSDQELSVVAYILEFLFDENRFKAGRIQLVEYLETNNWNGFRASLTCKIINYCKDERRKEMNSPFHFQYRLMSRALSEDKETLYCYRKETGAYYAVSKSPRLPFLEESILGAGDFLGWPKPGFPLKELNNPKVRIAISRIFWNHALSELDQEYFLPVIDLVRYMDTTYNFSRLIALENSGPIDGDRQKMPSSAERLHNWQPHDSSSTLAGQESIAERNLLNAALETAAIRLAQSWTPKMRVSFYLHVVCEETLAAAAKQIVGLNSPQAVSHHVNKADMSLREFFRQWHIEGYEGEKPTYDEQLIVLGAMIDFILKLHPECRDER